ncbi:uncharacterized protein LOC106462665 isoform X2 [Limulus polyphemus]|uniref:Uncharacterized protein LOC106462665 isoform X2 n=1 Tax=Limulus polyphemus TaxID=6850 RepID=A0ABM1BAE8_LIMPO|nr:uncharacterized protein LOC106462665 isoform X2 [Limulus polyphemus]
MFRVVENDDGSTLIYRPNTNELLCVVQENHRVPIDISEPVLTPESRIVPVPAPESKVVHDHFYYKGRDRYGVRGMHVHPSRDLPVSVCVSSLGSIPFSYEENYLVEKPDKFDTSSDISTISSSPYFCEDLSDECIDQNSFLRAFNLMEKSLIDKDGFESLKQIFPLRKISRTNTASKLQNLIKLNYHGHTNRIFEDIDLCSPLGQQILSLNKHLMVEPNSSLLSINKCEKYCNFSVVSLHSDIHKFPHLRSRDMLTKYPVTYRPFKKNRQSSSHLYSFNFRERHERLRVLQTGLNKRGRELKRLCKKVSVRVKRLTKQEIQKWLRKNYTNKISAKQCHKGDLYEVQFMDSSKSILSSSKKPILVFLPLSLKLKIMEFSTSETASNKTQKEQNNEVITSCGEKKNNSSLHSSLTQIASSRNQDLSPNKRDICFLSKHSPCNSLPKSSFTSSGKSGTDIEKLENQSAMTDIVLNKNSTVQMFSSTSDHNNTAEEMHILMNKHGIQNRRVQKEPEILGGNSSLIYSSLDYHKKELFKQLLEKLSRLSSETKDRTRRCKKPWLPLRFSSSTSHHKQVKVLKLPRCCVKLVDIAEEFEKLETEFKHNECSVKLSRNGLISEYRPDVVLQQLLAETVKTPASDVQNVAQKLLKNQKEVTFQESSQSTMFYSSNKSSKCYNYGISNNYLSSPIKQTPISTENKERQEPISSTNWETNVYVGDEVPPILKSCRLKLGNSLNSHHIRQSIRVSQKSRYNNLYSSDSNHFYNKQKKLQNFEHNQSVLTTEGSTDGLHYMPQNSMSDRHTGGVLNSSQKINTPRNLLSSTSLGLKDNLQAGQCLKYSEGERYLPISSNISPLHSSAKTCRIPIQGPNCSASTVQPLSPFKSSSSIKDRNLPNFQKEPTKWLFKCNGCGFAASFISRAQAEMDITHHCTSYHAVIDPAYHLAEYSLNFADHTEVVIEAFVGCAVTSPTKSPSVDRRLSAKAESSLFQTNDCSRQFFSSYGALDDVVNLDL